MSPKSVSSSECLASAFSLASQDAFVNVWHDAAFLMTLGASV